MQGERLKSIARRMMRALRPWEAGLAALVCMLVLISGWGGPWEPGYTAVSVRVSQQDAPAFAAADHDDQAWAEARFWQARPDQEIGWIRWWIPDTVATEAAPQVLHLSGPFSAEVYLNGVQIGAKGVLPTPDQREQAGAIDALMALPGEALKPTGNVLAIRYASTRAGYEPAAIIQGLAVTPYRPDARRSLRFYAMTLGLAGVLLVLSIVVIRLSRERSDADLMVLAAGLGGLVLAALAEMSRAYVNYPYDWHSPRQAVILLGVSVFCVSLFVFIVRRWMLNRPALIVLSVLTALGAGINVLSWPGYDGKIILVSVVVLSAGLGWTLCAGYLRDKSAWALSAVLVVFVAFNQLAPGAFIDRGLYALAAVAFTLFLFRSPDLLFDARGFEGATPEPALEPAPNAVLTVQSTGRLQRVLLDDIVFLKAAGNYTEVHRRSGGWVLDQRGLSVVMTAAGEDLVRVHRSYAVHQGAMESLISQPGSRYVLQLTNGAQAPVGRSRVADVRAALGS